MQRTQKFKSDVAGQLAEKQKARLEQLEQQRRELVKSMEELEVGGAGEGTGDRWELEVGALFSAEGLGGHFWGKRRSRL